nr:hypothetical protein Iba_chr06fCG2860 [Ipomoea batatas]
MVEGKHEELEVGEPGDEEGGDATEMDGVEGEREEEKERDYREEKQQPGKANGSHFCSEEAVGERDVYGEPYLDEDATSLNAHTTIMRTSAFSRHGNWVVNYHSPNFCFAFLLSTMGMHYLANNLSTFKSKEVPPRKGSSEIKSKEVVFHEKVLEQERTTKAKAALEGSVYIKENTISGDRTKNEDRRNGLDS